jgi:FtsP/CotA-like multicopper oxidase with cupredoxin domain
MADPFSPNTHVHSHHAPNFQEVSVTYGAKYCITLINSNADAHVFHLHGHVFTTVETARGRGFSGVWRDSVRI